MNLSRHGLGGIRWVLFLAVVPVLFTVSRAGSDELPPAVSEVSPLGSRRAPSAGGAPDTVPRYVGSESCESCHRPQVLRFAATPRGEILLDYPRTALERAGCESCHGPGSRHVAVEGRQRTPGFLYFDRNDPAPVETRNAACLQCHDGGDRILWLGSAHELRDVACTNCHEVHQVRSTVTQSGRMGQGTIAQTCATCHLEQVRRQEMSLARMPVDEGKVGCTSCHNPHGTRGEKLLLASSVNETCYGCHAEKRGPFLWEHAPVVERCTNCHDPHGSRNVQMLAVPMPRLCQQCHIATEHPSAPQAPGTRFVLGRQCANCHVTVHGSNHPGGIRFVR